MEMGSRTPAAMDGPAEIFRRQVLGAGTLMTAPLLAGLGTRRTHRPHRGLRVTTTSDLKTVLAQSPLPPFAHVTGRRGDVKVSPQQKFQPFLGVGAALTDSAAYVLANYMTTAQRRALLTDLF